MKILTRRVKVELAKAATSQAIAQQYREEQLLYLERAAYICKWEGRRSQHHPAGRAPRGTAGEEEGIGWGASRSPSLPPCAPQPCGVYATAILKELVAAYHAEQKELRPQATAILNKPDCPCDYCTTVLLFVARYVALDAGHQTVTTRNASIDAQVARKYDMKYLDNMAAVSSTSSSPTLRPSFAPRPRRLLPLPSLTALPSSAPHPQSCAGCNFMKSGFPLQNFLILLHAIAQATTVFDQATQLLRVTAVPLPLSQWLDEDKRFYL